MMAMGVMKDTKCPANKRTRKMNPFTRSEASQKQLRHDSSPRARLSPDLDPVLFDELPPDDLARRELSSIVACSANSALANRFLRIISSNIASTSSCIWLSAFCKQAN